MISKLNKLYTLNGCHLLCISYISIKLIYKETGRFLGVLWTGRGTPLPQRSKGKRPRQRLFQVHPYMGKEEGA